MVLVPYIRPNKNLPSQNCCFSKSFSNQEHVLIPLPSILEQIFFMLLVTGFLFSGGKERERERAVKKETISIKGVTIPAAGMTFSTFTFFWKIKQRICILCKKKLFHWKFYYLSPCWRHMYWLQFPHKIKFIIHDSFT